ncbi:MAG: S10 family peptidase [Rhizomicrobium sp.]
MKRSVLFAAALAALAIAPAGADPSGDAKLQATQQPDAKTSGTVTAGGQTVSYDAVAGTIVVHPKDYDDAATKDDTDNPSAVASMFYTAYFKHGADAARRPIMFLFNGGPGSSTVWLHMGAFGPRRVVTSDNTHTPAAPYTVVDNAESLLDVADLVFIDAPGAGFSRIWGKDAEKSFYGIDQDGAAFANFIVSFLGKYNRWNSPKYIMGESFGTMRAAVLADLLENDKAIDVNGVVLLSQVFDWDIYPDDPDAAPGLDLEYELALPSYAATAWYHHKLPGKPRDLRPLLLEVERFAMGDYARALAKGYSLDDRTRNAIAQKLRQYTGLSVAYILKSDLRVAYGPFQHELLGNYGLITGSLDTRYTGFALDPLAKTVDYDAQGADISSAYISAWNGYVRDTLHYGAGVQYKPDAPGAFEKWDWSHTPPGADGPIHSLPNVMPDMANAMKQNPGLKVMLNGGYFDVVTPYYEGWYEMHHLQIPKKLGANIEYHYYESGHMVYAHEPSLVQLHDNIAAFVKKTSGGAD